jgi:hypothetical protein
MNTKGKKERIKKSFSRLSEPFLHGGLTGSLYCTVFECTGPGSAVDRKSGKVHQAIEEIKIRS